MKSVILQRLIIILLLHAFNSVQCFREKTSPVSSPAQSPHNLSPQIPGNSISYPPGNSDSLGEPLTEIHSVIRKKKKKSKGNSKKSKSNSKKSKSDSDKSDKDSSKSEKSNSDSSKSNSIITNTTSTNTSTSSNSTSPESNSSDPELKKICEKTDYASLCISTVAPRMKGKMDINSVLSVAMNASYELAKVGNAKAKKLVMDSGNKGPEATTNKDCKDKFDDALYNFDQAFEASQKKDIGTMNSMLSAVITDMSDCEDEVNETGSSPLTDIAEKLADMTSNCLAIISQMH